MSFTCTNRHWRRIARLSCAAPWGRKNPHGLRADPEHGKQVKIEDVPQEQRDIFSLTNEEVQELAKQAVQIEKHYGRPMDIEWAKDGHTGKLFIVQARPETVRSRGQVMERYTLHSQGKIIAEGRAIGHRIGAGPVKVIHDISENEPHRTRRRAGY